MSELGTLDEATDPALARERRAAALVDAALEQPTRERAAWLDHACGDDDVLRTIAQRWLDAAEASEGTDAVSALVGPAFESLRPTLTDDGLPVGTMLGPWRLGAPLGEGGMGTVHEAHRADGAFEKRVAIKLVRTSWRSPALIRQFQRERTLLARLEHPGIARVLDAGVSDAGVPFLVMEYVDGQPITTWCDARRATVRERVRLVAAACDAVQAAHAQLIVHCDLKPSNLLVTPDGHVKLLDFGIAHALRAGDGTPDEPTLALTPAYASPEQRRGEPAAIASDVYALGAVLQRLLAGATLSPDLTAIMQRALAVAPADRYPTVDALHRDLDAWLDHRPVSARPLSGLARAARFVRRHILTVSLGAITLLVGIAGAGLTLWQAQRAAREAQLATEINDALLTVLAAPYPFDSTGTGTRSLRGLLDATRDRTAPLLARTDPRVSALRLSLSRGYAGLGDVAEAARIAEEVLRVRVRADGALARTTLPARVSLAEHVGRLGELPRSIAQFDTAIRIQHMGSGVAPREVAVLLQARARALFAAGALDAAEQGEREVIALFDSIGDRASVPYAHAWQVLGQIQHRRGQLAAADSSLRTSLAVREDMRGNPVEIANVEGDLGKVQLARGDHAAAMTLLTRSRARKVTALGAQDPEVADDDVALAMVALAAGRLDEARAFAAAASAAYATSMLPPARAVQGFAMEAEVALAANDLVAAARAIETARRTLDGDAATDQRVLAMFDTLGARVLAARQLQTASTSRKSSP